MIDDDQTPQNEQLDLVLFKESEPEASHGREESQAAVAVDEVIEFPESDDRVVDETNFGEPADEVEEVVTHTESVTTSERTVIYRPVQQTHLGAVLGAAIGDAMGHPTEFIRSFEEIESRYGSGGVRGFEKYWERDGLRFAPYTDDTQMAEAVLLSLLRGREEGAGLDRTMSLMGREFVSWSRHPQGGHRAPGGACMSGCRALANGVHWSEAGGARAGGCGSVMRAYPFGLIFAADLNRAEKWAVEHSKLTHCDPIALAACAAMAVGIARITRGDTLNVVVSEMIAAACRHSPRTGVMMAQALDDAASGVEPRKTLQRLLGWAAHEAIAAAVYIFVRHPDDPRAAILEGANTPGDSDSLATLAGALVGARCGVNELPTGWVSEVERSEELTALALTISDDVFPPQEPPPLYG